MKKLCILYPALLLSTALPSTAAIVVENTATMQSSAAAGDASFTFSGFDMSGGNLLAVLYSGERSEGGSDATDVDVTFGILSLSNDSPLVTVGNEGAQLASINYVLDPSISTGDVVVTVPLAYRGAVTVMSLSGVESLQDSASFGENLGTSTHNETLAGTAGGMVLGAAVDNTFGASAAAPTFSDGSVGFIDTTTVALSADFIAGDSSAGIVHGYGAIDTTGDFTQAFTPGTNGGSSSRNGGAYLTVVAAIPEPSIALLGGLGLLGLLRRRRVG